MELCIAEVAEIVRNVFSHGGLIFH
jgi:hypothetical protein